MKRRAVRVRVHETTGEWQARVQGSPWRGLLAVAAEVPGLWEAHQRLLEDPSARQAAREEAEGVALLVAAG